MKILNNTQKILGVLIGLSVIFGSCVKKDFDPPKFVVPNAGLTANTTIAQLKNRHTVVGKLDTIIGDTIIKGVVIGNDESGNIYKYIVIQDATGGIVINLDKASYYTEYPVGQRVFVKCKGLVLGDYNGQPQLGLPYKSGNVWSVGRIADVYVNTIIFKDSLPGKTPAPKVITSFSQLTMADVSTIVQFKRVFFTEVGKPFSETSVTTSRELTDSVGKPLTVRTSNYANFAADLLPSGKGTVMGVMGYYDGYQLTIRNRDDVYGFENTDIGICYPVISGKPVNSISENFASTTAEVDINFAHWVNKATVGSRLWRAKTFSGDNYAQATSYGANARSICWLITPAISYTSSKKLSFSSSQSYYSHSTITGFSVWILYDFDGKTGIWKKINANTVSSGIANYVWVPSGNINLSDYVPSNYVGEIYIGFKYDGSSSQTTNYSIDNIVIQ